MSMRRLRGLLSEHYDIGHIGGMKDDAVVDQLANYLSSGNLQVFPQMPYQRYEISEVRTTVEVPFPLSKRTRPAASLPVGSPATDPPTFSSDVLFAAQAAALVSAAAEGKPFCPE